MVVEESTIEDAIWKSNTAATLDVNLRGDAAIIKRPSEGHTMET